MSGALVTGLPAPNSLPGFLGTLQLASFRGVPFLVDAASYKTGRRQAVHEYPFRDGGWPEDMGRALRVYSFTGHLLGDLAPAMQFALNTVLELQGSGLLIHPTIGAVQVAVLSATSAVSWEEGRVIRVSFSFIEDSGTVFPSAIIATAASVLALVIPALIACNDDLGGASGGGASAGFGPLVRDEGATVVTSFTGAVTAAGADPSAIVGMATALPTPDADTSYGRYSAGNATALLPQGTTVATLQAQLAAQRAAIAATAAAAIATAAAYDAETDMLDPIAAVLAAMTGGMSNPGTQVRVLLSLAVFNYSDEIGGAIGINAAIATMRAAMSAACRRAALIALAQAVSAYQPTSYDDAEEVSATVASAMDVEIDAAGDAFEDETYGALKRVRSAVIQELSTAGASLPPIVTVSLRASMPTLAIAQLLYKDASRSDQLAAAAACPHPAFCPPSFNVLAR